MKLLDFKQIPENIIKDIMSVMKSKSNLVHNIELLKNLDKTLKVMAITAPVERSKFFNKFTLAETKANATTSSEDAQLAAITSNEPKAHNPLDDIMAELNNNLLNI